MLSFSLLMGLLNVKRDTRAHRRWMLRGVVYFSVVILTKVLSIISRSIITRIGGFYSIWRCDEALYVLQDPNALSQRFPQCTQNVTDTSNNPFSIAVLASNHGDKLERSSALRLVAGMCLWVSLIIYALGVEIYLHATDSQNQTRHGFVLEPRDFEQPEREYEDSRF
ncbi:hypothetical protein VKT23_012186 [Stygiomarasmius scandens]|uniref:Uncharacterized protein n=1 Tax=Marasmiellus scandens TaxID=2682957 RepID=A0ABR1J9Q0_9AGAR